MARLTESIVEVATPAWLECCGCTVEHGPNITADERYVKQIMELMP